ncbi:hypothetical protein FB451DRAFT_775417 [Mycena latifolia]|nr:hypothetical protein FB451DRAFT_775417 [Mycena latifolia]
MRSIILTAGLYALAFCGVVTAQQRPMGPGGTALDPDAQLQPPLVTGFYGIYNKAYNGQLVAFSEGELIEVLNNATIPKNPDLGKWKVKIVDRSTNSYSISNIGLGASLSFNEDEFIVAGKDEVLFSIETVGDKSYAIGNPDEENTYWTLYSYCQAEVHLDPASGDDGQMWEFRRWEE